MWAVCRCILRRGAARSRVKQPGARGPRPWRRSSSKSMFLQEPQLKTSSVTSAANRSSCESETCRSSRCASVLSVWLRFSHHAPDKPHEKLSLVTNTEFTKTHKTHWLKDQPRRREIRNTMLSQSGSSVRKEDAVFLYPCCENEWHPMLFWVPVTLHQLNSWSLCLREISL